MISQLSIIPQDYIHINYKTMVMHVKLVLCHYISFNVQRYTFCNNLYTDMQSILVYQIQLLSTLNIKNESSKNIALPRTGCLSISIPSIDPQPAHAMYLSDREKLASQGNDDLLVVCRHRSSNSLNIIGQPFASPAVVLSSLT